MNLIKPDHILWHEDIKHYQNKFLKIITGSVAFRLSAPETFLSEQEFNKLWNEVAQGLALDDCYPKTLSEVLVLGSYIPSQLASESVNLKIGDINKTLRIFPERVWHPAPKLNEFWPYTADSEIKNTSITWQNAYGGEGYVLNPEGKGFVAHRSALYDETQRVSLPLVEDPQHLLTEAFPEKHEIMPASLAPLSMLHPLRWQYTKGSSWDQAYPKIPEDINVLFFQQAAIDQTQAQAFKPKQAFSISGMNERGEIKGQLPNINVRMLVETKAKKLKELKTQCDTLWFLPNHDVGVMTFRGIDEVNDWNGNDHQSLMLTADFLDQPQSTQALRETFKKMTGAKSHLYRATQEGLMPEALLNKSSVPKIEVPKPNLDAPQQNLTQALDATKTEATKAAKSVHPKNLLATEKKSTSLRKEMSQRMARLKAKDVKSVAKIMPSPGIKNAIEQEDMLRDQVFANYDFEGVSFAGKTLENMSFSGANLKGVDFTESVLKKVNFVGAKLEGAQFRQAMLENVLFTDNDLKDVNFSFAQFNHCSFTKSTLSNANLAHANLSNCQFFQSQWRNVNAVNILIYKSLLSDGKWIDVDMSYAQLNNLRVNNQVFKQVDFSKSIGERNGFMGAKTNFQACTWQHCQWQQSNFLEAKFSGCNINNCSFPESEWMSAQFHDVKFIDNDLSHNAFNDAAFNEGTFQCCNLAHSRWQGASIKNVIFDNNFEYGVDFNMAEYIV